MTVFEALSSLSNKSVLYCFLESENHFKNKLTIASQEIKLELEIPQDNKSFLEFLGKLEFILSGTEILICWNIKIFFSLVYERISRDFVFEGKLFDLKIMETYLNKEGKAPSSFKEAFLRLKDIKEDSGYLNLMKIYHRIHIPLCKEVIPHLENAPLVDTFLRKRIYSFYEIEGQSGGRLKCHKPIGHYYNPHSLSLEDKQRIRPSSYEDVFLYLDFSSWEVYILQWLSNDSNLNRIFQTNRDIYESIWEEITSLPGAGKRDQCKLIFLPVVYGQGSSSLAERFGFSENTSKKIIDAIYKKFPQAMNWISTSQKNKVNEDYYGRRRSFDQDYKIRNFIVQSPAATISLDKLVKLHYGIGELAKLAFCIHDGYCILCNKDKLKVVLDKAKNILQAEDDFHPGLKLKVACKAGLQLENLKEI